MDGAPGISKALLAQRLELLERHGVVTKSRTDPSSRRTTYELTEKGRRPQVGHRCHGNLGRALARGRASARQSRVRAVGDLQARRPRPGARIRPRGSGRTHRRSPPVVDAPTSSVRRDLHDLPRLARGSHRADGLRDARALAPSAPVVQGRCTTRSNQHRRQPDGCAGVPPVHSPEPLRWNTACVRYQSNHPPTRDADPIQLRRPTPTTPTELNQIATRPSPHVEPLTAQTSAFPRTRLKGDHGPPRTREPPGGDGLPTRVARARPSDRRAARRHDCRRGRRVARRVPSKSQHGHLAPAAPAAWSGQRWWRTVTLPGLSESLQTVLLGTPVTHFRGAMSTGSIHHSRNRSLPGGTQVAVDRRGCRRSVVCGSAWLSRRSATDAMFSHTRLLIPLLHD